MSYSKISITGLIKLETGLHIGGSDAFAAIGAVDSPVIKDPLTNLPIIPGSSIKGKMRHLLAKAYNEEKAANPNQDSDRIKRLFGDSKTDEYKLGALLFRDAFLTNAEELDKKGAKLYTETKFENTIDRITAEANPRQIERAIRGSEFSFDLVYEVNENSNVKEDIETIISGLTLLEWDYLGGSGSRGYGSVSFDSLDAEVVYGDFKGIDEVKESLKELNN